MFPTTRLRRLRANPALRDMMRETTVTMNDLIYPIFVEEELDDYAPVESMPGVNRIPEKKLGAAIKEMHAAGIKAVMTFGVSHYKDDTGSDSWNENGLLARMIKRAKDAAPEMLVISDTCFCEYTSHGHCGVIHGDDVHNDHTIENLGRQSIVAARAGADMIAPSAMMDGQVAAIRRALDGGGFSGLPIMAYSSKFASACYGPFRDVYRNRMLFVVGTKGTAEETAWVHAWSAHDAGTCAQRAQCRTEQAVAVEQRHHVQASV